MANYPSIDKTRMTVRPSVALRAKMRTKIRASNGTLTENDIVILALERELANVTPDAEDVEWAIQERKRNALKRGKVRKNRT